MTFKCKLAVLLGALGLLGCENRPEENNIVVETPVVISDSTSAGSFAEIAPPLNCPVMIDAYSGFSKREGRQYLSFGLKGNPDFNPTLGDVCAGDSKNIWPDIMRFEAEIDSHFPNVKGWFSGSILRHNFPTTEQELKSFIDQGSKEKGLPNELDKIDRTTLEGGVEYNRKIRMLILRQEDAYWQTVHGPIVDSILSKYGTIRHYVGSEKHAYCYHPHDLCRGYARNDGLKPEDEIGVESEYDLEYLWAYDAYGFEMGVAKASSD